jgi:hypothetical protein
MHKRSIFKATCVALAAACTLTVGMKPAQARCSENVNGHLGWVLVTPITSMVFWPPGRPDALSLFIRWINLFSDPQFYSHVTEYGLNPGSVGQLLGLTSFAPTGVDLDENVIQYVLYLGLLSAGRVPQPGENFLVILPPGTRSNYDVQNGLLGHHNWVNVQYQDGSTHTIVYSVLEYSSDIPSMDYLASHELFETYVNPVMGVDANGNFWGAGWWDETPSSKYVVGNSREIADMCVNAAPNVFPRWSVGGTRVAQVWSQSMCACH